MVQQLTVTGAVMAPGSNHDAVVVGAMLPRHKLEAFKSDIQTEKAVYSAGAQDPAFAAHVIRSHRSPPS